MKYNTLFAAILAAVLLFSLTACHSGFLQLKNKHISLQKPPIVKERDLVK